MIAPLSILIYFAWKNNALERAEIIPPLQEKKKKKTYTPFLWGTWSTALIPCPDTKYGSLLLAKQPILRRRFSESFPAEK